jgi:hypothetical protein
MTESQPVHQLFALVLHMLNSMKQANKCLKGNQLAVVAGFRVENLKFIRDIKSYGNTDKPVTLLHYLIAIIQSKKDDTMLSLVTSLPNVEGASKLNIADLDIELKDLDKQLKNLDGAINFGEAETEKTLSVERLASLREYYNKAKVKLKSCATQLREAEKSFLSTAVYFGEKRDELTTQDEKQLLNPKSKSAQPGTFMKMISDFWTELDKTQRDLPRVKAAAEAAGLSLPQPKAAEKAAGLRQPVTNMFSAETGTEWCGNSFCKGYPQHLRAPYRTRMGR